MDRRGFMRGIAASLSIASIPLFTVPTYASGVTEILEQALRSGTVCGRNAAAIQATLARLSRTVSPGAGRTIVIDIPSQHLGAYIDGVLVFESRVVVGDKSWKTPDLDTTATYIRFNPTWTVPESIIKARGWREKLRENPAYFSRLNFLIESDGSMVEPEVAANGGTIGRFVQQPGPGNALGRVKTGLASGGAIYLHDTNDPDAFDEDSRALSHGCVRVERAVELAAWCLGIDDYAADDLVAADDRANRSDFPSPIRVVTTYFTAWPDASGAIVYYPDIYDRDGTSDTYCATQPTADAWGARAKESEYLAPALSPATDVVIYSN